jgi:uncharacterized protein (UPF0261 family)
MTSPAERGGSKQDARRPTVVLIGTLDTKGHEYAFLRDCLVDHDVEVVVVDTGVYEAVGIEADVGRDAVARAGGAEVGHLGRMKDRGRAVAAMAEGAEVVVRRLHREGRLDGVLALGGSGGSVIATRAMRALPIGVPKLMVSTVASGDTRPYVGAVDITMMYSVVDIAGVSSLSAKIMANAAGAMAGMVGVKAPALVSKPLVGATMFGVTTPCVARARERLEELGYEVLVFHATGIGGQTMEALAGAGMLAGVLDVTTTELADELVGGQLSAGRDRLEAAGQAGIPQVVSLGALDMVNFGPPETVPARFESRRIYAHNPMVSLMRTTPEECRELGRQVGRKLSAARGPTVLFVPLKGWSAIAVQGQPFYDPDADAAMLAGLGETLDGRVERHDVDADINDERFAVAMADRLHELIGLNA